jgi:hypothetical protein
MARGTTSSKSKQMKLSAFILACLLLFSPAAKAKTDLTCEIVAEWKQRIETRAIFLAGQSVLTDDWMEQQNLDWELAGLATLYKRLEQWESFNCIEI